MNQCNRRNISAVALIILSVVSAHAQAQRSFYELSLNPQALSVQRDLGGNIASYIIQSEEFRADQSSVAFNGSCESACTLYLGLAPEQICIMPGASFRFHAPSARSVRARMSAEQIMMKKYPDWVKDWIAANGGLRPQLMTMEYQTAKQHIQSCEASIY